MRQTGAMTEFDRLLAEAARKPLVGWDLSCDGRIATTAVPWDFERAVVHRARESPDLLDMGTGGGEWLGRLPLRPARTVATEGWAPNVAVARERLAPLGIEVVAVEGALDNGARSDGDDDAHDDAPLPFADGEFHLVVNRHESFVPAEVARVLARGGHFLTQQVASDFNADHHRLAGLAPAEPPPEWRLDIARRQLERAGFEILRAEAGAELLRFADVGAFAWYLKNVPYVCPDFTIEGTRDALEQLHRRQQAGEAIEVRQTLFWLEALR